MGNSRLLFTCLAFLLIAPATSPAAHAQGARGLPDPVSSAALERLLEGAGITDPPATLIDEPMARYLAAMETLRNGRIEAWLERRREGSGMFESPDPDLIRAEIEDRRRLLSAIAALDRTLFSELTLAGLDPDAIERAAARRTRDRAHAVIGRRFSRGIRIEPTQVLEAVVADGDGDPAWVIDDAMRNRALDHDRSRTERLERLADLVIERPLRAAEAMRDVEPPDLQILAVAGDGREGMIDSWLRARQAAKSIASEDARVLQASILQADTAFHDELTQGLRDGEPFAIAIDDAWRQATLPAIFPDRTSPRGLFESAVEAEERGVIEAETMEEIRALESSWRIRHAEIEARLLRAITKEIRDGEESSNETVMGMSAISLTVIGSDGEVVAGSNPEPTSASGRILAERSTLDREVRARLEAIAPTVLARRNAPVAPKEIFFGGEGGATAIGTSIMVIGDASFDLDDLGDLESPMLEMGGDPADWFRGARERIPRPIEPAAYALILERLGVANGMRSIADSLFADYRDAWEALDEGPVADWRSSRVAGFPAMNADETTLDGRRNAIDRTASLRLRILDEADALDAALFRDLAVLIDGEQVLDATVRRRRREIAIASIGSHPGMSIGSNGDQLANLDLEKIVTEVTDSLAGTLGVEYATEMTAAQFDRAKASIELDRIVQAAELEMFSDMASGAMTADADLEIPRAFERALGQRAELERSMRSKQAAWRDRMAAALPRDRRSDFLLAVDRAAHPSCFRDPDSPESRFDAALALPDLDAAQRTAIIDLRAEWLTEWTAACRSLVAIQRRAEGGMPMPGAAFDMSRMQKAGADRKQVRFARTELDERTVRSLLSILTPAQSDVVRKAPRSEPARKGFEGLNGFDGIESIEGGAIFFGG